MIVAFGAGKYFNDRGQYLIAKYGIRMVCDSDPRKWGTLIQGIKCISPEELRSMDCQVLVTIENPDIYRQICSQVASLGKKAINPWQEARNGKTEGRKQRVYIWGSPIDCRDLHLLLGRYSGKIEVIGYVSIFMEELGKDSISGADIVSLWTAQSHLRKGVCDGIVTVAPTMHFNFYTVNNVDEDILHSGKFYIAKRNIFELCSCKDYSHEKDELYDDIFIPYDKSYRAIVLQFMVTAKCNLKCKLCSHFSNLVSESEEYTYDEFQRDIKRMRELLDDVDCIDLWGGEAFLCSYIDEALVLTRELFPDSVIQLGTNGLLIPMLEEHTLETIKAVGARVVISMYKPTLSCIDDIMRRLNKYDIEVERGIHATEMKFFARRFNPKGKSDAKLRWDTCTSRECTTVYKGELSPCYFPVTARFYNECFGKEFDIDDDLIDILDPGLSKEEFIKKMRKPINACRYCDPYQPEYWTISRSKPHKEDWVYC